MSVMTPAELDKFLKYGKEELKPEEFLRTNAREIEVMITDQIMSRFVDLTKVVPEGYWPCVVAELTKLGFETATALYGHKWSSHGRFVKEIEKEPKVSEEARSAYFSPGFTAMKFWKKIQAEVEREVPLWMERFNKAAIDQKGGGAHGVHFTTNYKQAATGEAIAKEFNRRMGEFGWDADASWSCGVWIKRK